MPIGALRPNPCLISPGPKPLEIVPGDQVQVAVPCPGRPDCFGSMRLVFWSSNRNCQNPARTTPQPQWVARVEFTSQHAWRLGPRVTYTLPIACLRKESTTQRGGSAGHA